MKLAIVGCRYYKDYEQFAAHDEKVARDDTVTEIVSGGASGADTLAERYAKENNIPLTVFPADWKTHGREAGPMRNRQIVQHADRVLAFWDGVSAGTRSTIGIAKEMTMRDLPDR